MTPTDWRNAPRAARVEMAAYEYYRAEKLSRLMDEIRNKTQGDGSIIAQVMVMLNG